MTSDFHRLKSRKNSALYSPTETRARCNMGIVKTHATFFLIRFVVPNPIVALQHGPQWQGRHSHERLVVPSCPEIRARSSLISSWYSLKRASLGSSLIRGRFWMLLALSTFTLLCTGSHAHRSYQRYGFYTEHRCSHRHGREWPSLPVPLP